VSAPIATGPQLEIWISLKIFRASDTHPIGPGEAGSDGPPACTSDPPHAPPETTDESAGAGGWQPNLWAIACLRPSAARKSLRNRERMCSGASVVPVTAPPVPQRCSTNEPCPACDLPASSSKRLPQGRTPEALAIAAATTACQGIGGEHGRHPTVPGRAGAIAAVHKAAIRSSRCSAATRAQQPCPSQRGYPPAGWGGRNAAGHTGWRSMSSPSSPAAAMNRRSVNPLMAMPNAAHASASRVHIGTTTMRGRRVPDEGDCLCQRHGITHVDAYRHDASTRLPNGTHQRVAIAAPGRRRRGCIAIERPVVPSTKSHPIGSPSPSRARRCAISCA